MVERERILAVIYGCLDSFNVDRSADEQVVAAPSTPLQGPESSLDSLGLIMLSVNLEDAFDRELGVRVSLVSELGMFDGDDSPLASVGSLATWVERIGVEGA